MKRIEKSLTLALIIQPKIIAMKRSVLILLLLIAPAPIWAQEVEQHNAEIASEHKKIPPHYGSLLVGGGLCFLIGAPSAMELAHLYSQAFSGHFYYNIPIKHYPFTVSIGPGMGLEDYQLTSNHTLTRDPSRETILTPAKSLFNNRPEIKYARMAVKYVELVAELRFQANQQEPLNSFFIAIGGSLGMRYSPSTTIYHEEDSEQKTRITRESFNINKLRYGLIARIGWGRFGAFYTQTFSHLFRANKVKFQNPMSASAGISLSIL